jgi:hypothetical protein
MPAALNSEPHLRIWSLHLRVAMGLGALSGLYRNWIGRALGVAPDSSTLITLGNLIRAERGWRLWLSREARLPGADDEARRLTEAEEAFRKESHDYLTASLVQGHAQGRHEIEQCADAWPRKTWGQQFGNVLHHVPAWATTTLSTRHLWPRPGLFDLAVIDEASQCSIPQVLPVLYRARRALVIGDPNQLTHVTRLSHKDEEECRREACLSAAWLDRREVSYRERSAFDAFAHAAGRPLLLDEHYRCHPAIIEVSNCCYYAGQLVVLTDPTELALRDAHPVRWQHVAGRAEHPSRGSCRNDDEVRAVIDLVRRLDATLPATVSIGVVTPFRAQRVALERAFQNARVTHMLKIGTIHTFQGGERDVMVLSPVAAAGIRQATVDWLRGQANLWNVAITRAKSMLYVVGDRTYWEAEGKVRALRDVAFTAEGLPRPRSTSTSPGDPIHHLGQALMDSGVGYHVEAEVDGYPCDVLLGEAGDRVALVIDSAAGRPEPGRHLRQVLRQCDLLLKAGATRAIRAPAWRCISRPDQVVAFIHER